VQRSLRHRPPKAAGVPCGILFAGLGIASVVYRDDKGPFHEPRETPLASDARDLTELADNAIRADGDPTVYVDTTQGHEVVLYRGKNGHVHSLYWAAGRVRRDELSATAGAPKVAPRARPVGFVQRDGTNVAIYRAEHGHLQSLAWTGTNAPTTEQLSGSAASPSALSDPAPFVNTRTGGNIVAYVGSDRDIHSLHWSGVDPVAHENLSAVAGAPKAAGNPVAYYTAHDDMHQVIYRGEDKHVHELWWVGVDVVRHRDLTVEASGSGPTASDPVAWFSAGARTKHVVYRSADGHLRDLSRGHDGRLVQVDLTVEAVAPPAVDSPAAFTIEGPNTQHVVYRGSDGQIHEICWFDRTSPALLQPDWRWCHRCQGLFYGPSIHGSRCPAGGAHAAPDQSGSANYVLPHGPNGTHGGQSEWRWCNRCQGLFYGPNAGTSSCPAGGAHGAPAQSGSVNYAIAHGWDGGPGRQGDWRWCSRCQGLFYGPYVGGSRCPAGGAHVPPAQSGSVDYKLITQR
jgi:hypothetical protein